MEYFERGKIFKIKNLALWGLVMVFLLTIFCAKPTPARADMAHAADSGKSFVVTSYDSMPSGVAFSSDGSQMYVSGRGSKTIYQFILSRPWDVSTASFVTSSDVIYDSQSNPFGLVFKSDGTKMYLGDYSDQKVYEYSLSIAWDITSAIYNDKYFSLGMDATGLSFKPDGTKMYVTSYNNRKVEQYSLSTAWDITSAVDDNISLSVSSQESQPYCNFLSPDGAKIYVMGDNNDTVYEYSLSTAWDLSSGSYNSVNFNFSSVLDAASYGITINPGLDTMYIVGAKSSVTKVAQFDITGLVGYWSLDEGSGATVFDRSGYGNNGTWEDTPTYSAGVAGAYSGVFSKVPLHFISVPDSAQLNFASTSQFSTSVWIKPSGWFTWHTILSKDIWTSNAGWVLDINDAISDLGKIRYTRGGEEVLTLSTDYIIPLDIWTNVIVTNNNGSASVYINGSLVATSTVSMSDAATNLNIGARDSTLDGFTGSIDEVKIYNKALSVAEVESIYASTPNSVAATPIFSPEAGTVSSTTQITITSTGATHIYYTTDGSAPTASSSDYLVTGPITLSGDPPETIKAYATKDGAVNSLVVSSIYSWDVQLSFDGGDGSTSTPYQISTCEQLQLMNSNLSAYYELTENVDCVSTTNWNSSAGFNPIGSAGAQFTGGFDGNNFDILNLYINRTSTSYVGLFGLIGINASVGNVGLVDVNITGKNVVGGLVGLVNGQDNNINQGVITNSHTSGDVNGRYYVGGLVGMSRGVISNSTSTATVIGGGENQELTPKGLAGGLVGRNAGYASITNSSATGNVTGTNYVGGLIGANLDWSGFVSSSYATGNVTGTNYVGGLVGRSSREYLTEGIIYDSYATGNVVGTEYVGGLVGENWSTITDSYASGTFFGAGYVGGLVGYNNHNISQSYSHGVVSGYSGSVGGLVGENNGGSVSTSYSNCSVTGDGVEGVVNNVGGLVGRNNEGLLMNVYATGDVTSDGSNVGGLVGFNGANMPVSILNSYATGNVVGVDEVGGLVGLNNNDDIQNSFAVGTVTGLSDGFYEGFVGYDFTNSSTLYTNNFWYNNKYRGINSEFGFEDEIIGRWEKTDSASVFKNTSTTAPFVGNWDFDTVWETSIGNYPTLRAFSVDDTSDLFAGGEGTTSSPYQISTCAQLQNISTDAETLAAHYILTDDINCSSTVNWNQASGYCSYANKNNNTQATCDGDYTWTTSSFYKGFNPIGCGRIDEMCWDRTQASFTGVFDGNDKEISNLYINRREYYVGLFGAIGAGAEVKNLNIIDANINSADNVSYAGVLAGFISSESAINSVNVAGTLNAPSSTFVGGIGGYHDYQEECFLAGTPILMQDGSHKNIEAVQIGDTVTAYNEINNQKISGTVAKTFIHQVDHYLLINNNLKVTSNHPLYVNGKWLAAGNAKIGDILMDEKGKTVKINSIIKIYDNVTVYNLEVNPKTGDQAESCGPGHSYFAGGILAHNKCPVIATDDGTGYKFNTKINVFNEGKANEKIFKYKMNAFSNGVVKMSYDPYDIDYVNYVAVEITDTKGVSTAVHKLEPLSCSGNGCDVSLLQKIDDKYLVLDKNNTEVSLDFGQLPSLPAGYTRSFQIISSGYQKVLKQAHPFDYPDEINKWFRGYFDWYYGGAHHTIATSSAKVDIDGYDYVGGILGYNAGDIRNSYSTSSVTGHQYVGGVVGYSDGNILGSYSTGDIYGYNQEVGGLVGKNVGVVSNSYAIGDVISETDYVGGLVGVNMSNIYTSYSTGNVTGTSNVGGFAGANAFGTIYSSFSTAQSVVGFGDYIGGFIGSSPDPYPNTGWVTITDMSAIGIGTSEPVATIDYNETTATPFYSATHGVYTAGDNVWDFTETPIWDAHANHLPTLHAITADDSSVAQDSVYVKSVWNSESAGGHSWGVDAFDNIPDALAAVSATGTVNLLDSGSDVDFNISSTINIDKPVTIIGEVLDEGKVFIQGNSCTTTIFNIIDSNVTISNLKFAMDEDEDSCFGVGEDEGDYYYAAVAVGGEDYIVSTTISNNNFTSSTAGVMVNPTASTTAVSLNVFTDNFFGLWLGAGAVATGNEFSDNFIGVFADNTTDIEIGAADLTGMLVASNTFSGLALASFYFWAGDQYPTSPVYFVSNTIDITDGDFGIFVGGNAYNLHINHNKISTSSAGMYIGGAETGLDIVENWWGDVGGPYIDDINTDTDGSELYMSDSLYVFYRPFCINENCTQFSTNTIAAANLSDLFSPFAGGTMTVSTSIPGDFTSIDAILVNENTVITIPVGDSQTTITLPADTIITKSNGGIFSALDVTSTAMALTSFAGFDANQEIQGAFQFGIPETGLAFSPAITIQMYVGIGLSGQTLNIRRSLSATEGWVDTGLVESTCVVDSVGICTFHTTLASYYAATKTVTPVSTGGGSMVVVIPRALAQYTKLDFAINNGEQLATNNVLNILMNADPKYVSGYAISLDKNFSGASIIKYTTTTNFILPQQDGVYTVYLKYFSSTGNVSEVISHNIEYKAGKVTPKKDVGKMSSPFASLVVSSTASSTVSTVKSVVTKSKYIFKRDLKFGMTGADVKELQKFLNNNGFIIDTTGVGSPGKESTRFGSLTQKALIKFQKANKIKPAVGYFGAVTRKVVNGK